jgi:hypothetical protein
MAAMGQRREIPGPSMTGAEMPRIVNGLTVRPREKINVWCWVGFFLLPDVAALFVLIAIAMHRLLRYLGTKGKNES